MKLAILISSYKSFRTMRDELADCLLAAGNSLIFVGPFDGEEQHFVEKGCQCINVPIQRRGTSLLADIKVLAAYRQILQQLQPEAVLTFSVKANTYGALMARWLKIPRIISITGLGSGFMQGGLLAQLLRALYKPAFKGAACVFFQNTANLAFMQKLGILKHGQRYRLISGSGVNLQRFQPTDYPADGEGIRFLFIGRVMREKGIKELTEAFEQLYQRKPHIHLDILGLMEEDYTDKIKQLCSHLPISYHGQVEDVRLNIAASHATVLPSYHEGMANALLESAAMARPVIASRVPGCIETFDEGVSGLGCAPRDAQSLTEAMSAFLNLSHNQRVQMGLAGRTKMEREFNRQKVIDAYLQEIDNIYEEQHAS